MFVCGWLTRYLVESHIMKPPVLKKTTWWNTNNNKSTYTSSCILQFMLSLFNIFFVYKNWVYIYHKMVARIFTLLTRCDTVRNFNTIVEWLVISREIRPLAALTPPPHKFFFLELCTWYPISVVAGGALYIEYLKLILNTNFLY